MKSELQAGGRQLAFLELFPKLHFMEPEVQSSPKHSILSLGWACLYLVPGTTAGNMSACGCSVRTRIQHIIDFHIYTFIYLTR